MIINEKNTALHLLKDGDRMTVGIDQGAQGEPAARQFLHEVFPAFRPFFRQRVRYVTRPFKDVYVKVQRGLDRPFVDVPVEQSGTFIFPSGDLGTQTSFFHLSAGPGRQGQRKIHCTIISFINVEDEPQPILCHLVKFSSDDNWSFDEDRLMERGVSILGIVECILGLVIFTKFWELKKKVVLPGQQVAHRKQWYDNDTKQPIEILDWTRFRKIV